MPGTIWRRDTPRSSFLYLGRLFPFSPSNDDDGFFIPPPPASRRNFELREIRGCATTTVWCMESVAEVLISGNVQVRGRGNEANHR